MKDIDEQQIHKSNKLYYKILGLYVRFEHLKGINNSVYKVLHALSISDLHRQKDIMQNYEMPKQTINNVVISLQKHGFVEVKLNKNDKREKILNLTQKGMEYVNDFLAEYMAFEKKVYQKLGARKLNKLIEIYADFERAFNEVLNDEFKKKG